MSQIRYGVGPLLPAAEAALSALPPEKVGVIVIAVPRDQTQGGRSAGLQCVFREGAEGVDADWLIQTLRAYANEFEKEKNERIQGANADRGSGASGRV